MTEGSDVNYWSLVTILGPLLLLAVIVWAMSRNRKARRNLDRTEQATRDLYAEEQRLHERDPGSGL
jgi:cbb3-type cytochrome oxidase subunit 3